MEAAGWRDTLAGRQAIGRMQKLAVEENIWRGQRRALAIRERLLQLVQLQVNTFAVADTARQTAIADVGCVVGSRESDEAAPRLGAV